MNRTNKTIAKKLKRQKPTAWKPKKNTIRKKIKAQSGYEAKNQVIPKKSSTWKLPGISLLFLFTIILVVPTMIVVPFITDNSYEATSLEKKDQTETTNAKADEEAVSVAVMRTQNDKVENVPLEDYVSGVVASEMPANFELEALKAQALAARTFIVYRMLNQDNNPDAAVLDTVDDQVYSSEEDLRKRWGSEFNEKMNKIKKAVEETKGEILTYKDTPIFPAFFSTSNGYTENSEDYWENKLPYLRSVESPWDKNTEKYLDQKTFSIKDVETALNIDLPNTKNIPIEVTRTKGKRVKQLTLGDHTFSGREVREKLQLRSSDFTIDRKNNHLIFTTKGFGHGIGMSQYGANGMAKEGKTYKDIVQYYFQDVEVNTITEVTPALVAK